MERVRIAVIGVGHLGHHHARLLNEHPQANLVAIAEPHDERRAEAMSRFGVPGVSDYRDLVGEVDAVSVVVPTAQHRAIAGFFLENGADVFVEKPIAMTVAEGCELVDLAREKDAILQVGHVERFNTALKKLSELITGARYIESQRLAPFSFRSTDVGAVLDLMIHDIDLVLHLVRSPIKSVDAFGGSLFTPAEDAASAIIKFENGAVAHLTANRIALKPMRRMRMFSKDSYASVDFNAKTATYVRKNPGWDMQSLDAGTVDPASIPDLWKFVYEGLLTVEEFKLDEGNPLLDELAAFLASVRDRTQPPVTGEDGVRAVEAAHAVLAAIEANSW